MENYKYLAVIAGGIDENVWDREVEIEAYTFSEAVKKIEKHLEHDEIIISMEQME